MVTSHSLWRAQALRLPIRVCGDEPFTSIQKSTVKSAVPKLPTDVPKFTLPAPLKTKALPTSPAPKLTPLSVPLAEPSLSNALSSARHQCVIPLRIDTGCWESIVNVWVTVGAALKPPPPG